MTERFNRFLCRISQIDLYWHRIASAEMERYGLRGATAIYLTMLLAAPEGLTAAQLSSQCGRDKADVSRDITRLIKAEMVSRIPCEGKTYRAQLVLTETGRQIAREISAKAAYAVDMVGRNLSVQERASFYLALDDIANNLKVLSQQGLPDTDETTKEEPTWPSV